MPPFEADLGYNPHMPLNTMVAVMKPQQAGGIVVVNFVTKMNDILEHFTNAVKVTQSKLVQEANKK
jgi:hypothetical protein